MHFIGWIPAYQPKIKLLLSLPSSIGSKQVPGLANIAHTSAIQTEPSWYKAWHLWASMHLQLVIFYEKEIEKKTTAKVHSHTTSNLPLLSLQKHLQQAVKGLVKSISLSPGNNLQDTLQLLTILYNYSSDLNVVKAIAEGAATLPIDTWIQVGTIQKRISRLGHSPNYCSHAFSECQYLPSAALDVNRESASASTPLSTLWLLYLTNQALNF